MNSAVIFGAGNIGRSFIGNIFASNGWKVTFIDANRELVDALNARGEYPVLIKRNSRPDERIVISGINAIHSSDTERVIEILCSCTLCSTSVGQNALRFVIPQIADAVKARAAIKRPPLDIIIAENIRNGADRFREIFREKGLKGDEAGLVETSIGKMVPIMSMGDLADDPLVLHAEEYSTLILDAEGFLNTLPALPEIKAVKNIPAWVDRKLFIHNLGHAASAYFGFQKSPGTRLIAESVADKEIKKKVRSAMDQAAAALLAEYPQDFTARMLEEHIDDLLLRFENLALGDTVFRVGRDLYRKLNRNDRVLGAAALCIRHSLPCDSVIDVFAAATGFRACDDSGNMFERDADFHENLQKSGLLSVLRTGLDLTPAETRLEGLIMAKMNEN